MTASARQILPELLDQLSPSDPRACRSRRDLRRVHRAMGSVSILRRAIVSLRLTVPPRRILELGAGDGSLLLRLARAMSPRWHDVALTLLDRQDLVSAETLLGYEALGWKVTVVREDVLDWVAKGTSTRFDLCIACLFLHHFDANVLAALMRAIASSADAFVACEPRRNWFARLGSSLVVLLGANFVTREDAAKSVRAGFTDQELTVHWPHQDGAWSCKEFPAFPFAHCFTAVSENASRE